MKKLVHPEGVEPPTSWSVAKRSIQLSYGCTLKERFINKPLWPLDTSEKAVEE